MRPADGARYWRKSARKARRGIPAGRRATHIVKTAYGQQQRLRDQQERFSAFCAARRALLETVNAGAA